MKVTFLGTGTASPEPSRGPTATLVEHDGRAVLVDAGSGTLQKLAARGRGVDGVDALLLTHDHLDHFADVLPLLFSLRISRVGRERPLEIFASPQTHARIRAVQGVFDEWLKPAKNCVTYVEVEPGSTVTCSVFRVSTMRPRHAEASIGYRFETEDGRSVVLPGDTGWTSALVPFISGADLAVLECAVSDANAVATHLSPLEIRRLVTQANPGALAIVHRYPSEELEDVEAIIRATWDGHVFIPDDGDCFEVGGE